MIHLRVFAARNFFDIQSNQNIRKSPKRFEKYQTNFLIQLMAVLRSIKFTEMWVKSLIALNDLVLTRLKPVLMKLFTVHASKNHKISVNSRKPQIYEIHVDRFGAPFERSTAHLMCIRDMQFERQLMRNIIVCIRCA